MEGERGEGRYEGIWREEERGRYGRRREMREGRKKRGRDGEKGEGEMKGHVGGKRTLLMKEG